MTCYLQERYSRQMAVPNFGLEGQQRLARARVLVVGLGGLGAPVAVYLARAGVGRLGLCDADAVSVSNLHRQLLYTDADTGVPKAQAACRVLAQVDSGTKYQPVTDGFHAGNAAALVHDYDLVVDCTDNFATRFLIDDTCHAARKPWIMGSVQDMAGMVTLFGHGRARMRYSDLFEDRHALCSQPPKPTGIIGPVAGVIGSIQATEAVKLLAGLPTGLDGQLLTVDLSTMNFNLCQL